MLPQVQHAVQQNREDPDHRDTEDKHDQVEAGRPQRLAASQRCLFVMPACLDLLARELRGSAVGQHPIVLWPATHEQCRRDEDGREASGQHHPGGSPAQRLDQDACRERGPEEPGHRDAHRGPAQRLPPFGHKPLGHRNRNHEEPGHRGRRDQEHATDQDVLPVLLDLTHEEQRGDTDHRRRQHDRTRAEAIDPGAECQPNRHQQRLAD